MKAHNIQYYVDSVDKFVWVLEENRTRGQLNRYLNPIQIPLHWLADKITIAVLEPTKGLYHALGTGLAKGASPFSPKMAKAIKTGWHDPISAQSVRKILGMIQSSSRVFAVRKPMSIPFLGFFDQAGIALAQHIYIVSTDLKEFLNLRSRFYQYIAEGAEAAKRASQSTLASRAWAVVRAGFDPVLTILNNLIQRIIKLVQKYPRIEIALWEMKNQMEKGYEEIYAFLVGKTHEAIEYGESRVRQKIASKIANFIAKQVIRSSVGAGLYLIAGRISYHIGDQLFAQATGLKGVPPEVLETVRKVAFWGGVVLWIRFLNPIIDDLHQDYRKDFDPDTSALTELSNLFSRRTIAPVVSILREKIHSKLKNLSC